MHLIGSCRFDFYDFIFCDIIFFNHTLTSKAHTFLLLLNYLFKKTHIFLISLVHVS